MTRGRKLLLVAGVTLAVGVGLGVTRITSSQAAPTSVACGAFEGSLTKTDTTAVIAKGTPKKQVTSVAVKGAKCVKVTFTAAPSCLKKSTANGSCNVYFVIDNHVVAPFVQYLGTTGSVMLNGSYLWAAQLVGTGNHNLSIQINSTSSTVEASVQHWVADFGIYAKP